MFINWPSQVIVIQPCCLWSSGQFQCPTCGKHFKTEHYVKSHMLIHTGENPFQCEVCQASFNRKDKLKRHMTIHDAVKKYRCPFKSLTGELDGIGD